MGLLAVDRVAAVLDALADGATTLPEVCDGAGLPKSSASRLLSALEEHQLVHRASDGSLSLGATIGRLGAKPPALGRLIDAARMPARSLANATNEAVCLSVIDAGETHTVFQVDTPKAVFAQDWVDRRWPIQETGSAIAILSTWSPTEVASVLSSFGARTQTKLHAAIDVARRQPICWSIDNYVDGLTSVAAPIASERGRATSALIIYGPSYRFPNKASRSKIESKLAATAVEIGKELY